MKHKLTKLHKGIFLLEMDDSYDLAMTFCRVQEFYESPFKEIRGKKFTMSQLMRLYSKKFGNGFFSYPVDWSGFNVPSKAICSLYYTGKITDINEYDDFIQDIDGEIERLIQKEHHKKIFNFKYYLIGAETGAKQTIDHEVAHGLYYLNKSYRDKTNKIVNSIHTSTAKKIKKYLFGIGYSENVFKDEVQAYLSNDPDHLIENSFLNKKEIKDLQKKAKEINILFNDYSKRQN